jgi:hypothetical protein
MTPIIKKLAISGGLILLGSILVGYNKVSQLAETFNKIAIAPYGVRNIRIGFNEIKFDLDIILKNNDINDFYVTGSVAATLTRIEILYKGSIIGTAFVNISEIGIPAYSSTILKNIPIVIPTAQIINNLPNLQDIQNNLTIIGYVEVLGSEHQIGV